MRAVCETCLLAVLWLLFMTPAVHGAQILHVGCHLTLDKAVTVTVYINLAHGKFVYILGCPSNEGEFNGFGVPTHFLLALPFFNCNIQWDTLYYVFLTEIQGIIQGTETFMAFMCVRNTASITAVLDFTVTASTDISLITESIQPSSVFMKITDAVSDKDGSSLSYAAIGDTARLHIWTNDAYDSVSNPSGIDIMVRTIEVTTGGTVIVLTGVDGANTYDGCKSKTIWADVQDIALGYVMVEFQIYYLAPPGTPSYDQTYSADVDVCVGAACPNYDCSLNGLGGAATQAGRRKRDTSKEEVRVTSHVRVFPDNLVKAYMPNTGVQEDAIADPVQKCEVCTEKRIMHGVFASLAAALLLSLIINCLVYTRTRGIRTCVIRDKSDVESYRSTDAANTGCDVERICSNDAENTD